MKIKKHLLPIFITLLLTSGMQAQHENHHMPEEKSTKSELSPHTSAMAYDQWGYYSSPRVRERIIFGGLVGYNTVWQAGAHKATWIETNKDLLINGKILPAGKYGFFVIPGKEKWTVMFNSRWEQHGKDEYDPKEDVLSIDVAPKKLTETKEALTYVLKEEGKDKGIISLVWENTKISIPF